MFVGVINRGTLQLLIWRKTGLQPGSWLRKARTRSYIRLRHTQAPAECSLLLCLAAKHLSLKDDNISASQVTAEHCSPSPGTVHAWHCPGFVPSWWMGLRNSTSQTKGFWLYLCPDMAHHQTMDTSVLAMHGVGVLLRKLNLESSHVWSPQNIFLKFSLPQAAVSSCWVMTTGVMLPWLQLRVQSRCSDLSYILLGVAKIIYICNHYILFKGKQHIRTETCGLQTYYFLPENLSKAMIKYKTKVIQTITGTLSQI